MSDCERNVKSTVMKVVYLNKRIKGAFFPSKKKLVQKYVPQTVSCISIKFLKVRSVCVDFCRKPKELIIPVFYCGEVGYCIKQSITTPG